MSWVCKICSNNNEDDNVYECFVCGAPDLEIKKRIVIIEKYKPIKRIYDFLINYVFRISVLIFCASIVAIAVSLFIIRPFPVFPSNIDSVLSSLRDHLLTTKNRMKGFLSSVRVRAVLGNLQKISVDKGYLKNIWQQFLEIARINSSMFVNNVKSFWIVLIGLFEICISNIKGFSLRLSVGFINFKTGVLNIISFCNNKIKGWK